MIGRMDALSRGTRQSSTGDDAKSMKCADPLWKPSPLQLFPQPGTSPHFSASFSILKPLDLQ